MGAVLTDRSHGGHGIGAQGQIVKTNDTDVLRYPQAQLLTAEHDGMGQQVMATQDSGDLLLEKLGEELLQTIREEVVASGQSMVVGEVVLAQSLEKGAETNLINI